MGAQFIFVVEADEKCKSDWNYIKATIERFYTYDPAHVKLKPVYMAGKNNYRNKKKEVNTLMRKYKGNTEKNQSIQWIQEICPLIPLESIKVTF
ncbi:MAG: hypothetical protein KBT48_04855 [Firmicutes bacterium]|nr:hypothetical protein [Bacillota bacterium]